MTWHYWGNNLLYPFIFIPLHTLASLKHGIFPWDMIHANPCVKYGIGLSKKEYSLNLFKSKKQFLHFIPLKAHWSSKKKGEKIEEFLKSKKIAFPIIAKPSQGDVGIGIRKINNKKELYTFINKLPFDYLLQEYCDYPYEFGVFYVRLPNKKGRIVSLTEKMIPSVKGDGISTVKELVMNDDRYHCNRENLLKHAKNLDYIPKKNEQYQVIVQGSHTYGAIFKDKNKDITKNMHPWIQKLGDDIPGFYYGRFDMKCKSKESLKTGKGIKIVEINGEGSDPIHVYDDTTSLWKGIREFYRFFDMLYTIAAYVKKNEKMQYVPLLEIAKEFKKDKWIKKETKRKIDNISS